jgi:hypothetical protein
MDDQLEQFLKMFENSNIPHPEHEPIRFAYLVKLFKFEQQLTKPAQ